MRLTIHRLQFSATNSSLMAPKTGYKTTFISLHKSAKKISPTAPLLANSSTWLRGRCTTAQLHIPLTASLPGKKRVWLLPASSPCLQSSPPLPSLFSVSFSTLILHFPLEINWNSSTAILQQEMEEHPKAQAVEISPYPGAQHTLPGIKAPIFLFAERKASMKAQILTVSLV